MTFGGYPGGIGIKNPHANAGNVTDVNSIPVSRRLPKVGNGSHSNILLGNSIDGGIWWDAVHRVAESQT